MVLWKKLYNIKMAEQLFELPRSDYSLFMEACRTHFELVSIYDIYLKLKVSPFQ
jgi:hypothetical protein